MNQQYNQVIQQFRVDIRRKHIDNLFKENRQRINQQLRSKRIQEMRTWIQNSQKKTQLVYQYAKKFETGYSQQWQYLLNDLYYLSKVYENDHQLWITSGLLKSITNIYKLYIETNLNIKHLLLTGSNILTDIFFMNSSQHPKVIKSLLTYQFIDYFIQIVKAEPYIQHLRLLARILYSVPQLRQYLYKLQCLEIAIRMIEKTENISNQQILMGYYIIYGFVKIHDIDQNTSLNPKKGCVQKIINFTFGSLLKIQDLTFIELMIKSLYEIAKLKKEQIYSKLVSSRQIINKMIQIMCFHKTNSLRISAGRFLAQVLMSTNPLHIQKIFDCGIISNIYRGYYENKNSQSTLVYLSILSNITADSNAYQNALLGHPIFNELILNESQNSINPIIRKQALYCLGNFVYDKTSSQIDRIMSRYNILQTLVDNFLMTDTHPDSVRDIINIWKSMIQDCSRDQSVQQNTIYTALVHYYNICDYLISVQGQLQTDIEQFLDYLNNYGNSE